MTAVVSFARCPAGRRLVTHGTEAYDVCENIDECAEFAATGVPLCRHSVPLCRHGVCRDLDDGYVCHCDPYYEGPDCSTKVQAPTWNLSSSTLVVLSSSITILLGNCLSQMSAVRWLGGFVVQLPPRHHPRPVKFSHIRCCSTGGGWDPPPPINMVLHRRAFIR